MCLHLEKDAKINIAKEDIVVYKFLQKQSTILSKKYSFEKLHGKSFTGIIKGIHVVGKISIHGQIPYFCTNEPKLNGSDCDEKFEFYWSWRMDYEVSSIIIDDEECYVNDALVTQFQKYPVIIGETYTSKLIKEKHTCEVHKGLHSYKYRINTYSENILVECIIPKGSKYYEGIFSGEISYASNRLKYIKIL